MPELWIVAGLAVLVGIGLAVRVMRAQPEAPACEYVPEGREGELAVRLAKIVGCTPLRALPSVRQELDLAPAADDDVILKRAAYHYRNALPEREPPAYRDKVRG